MMESLSKKLKQRAWVELYKKTPLLIVAVETNRVCNLGCSFCAVHKMLSEGKLQPHSMSLETYYSILLQVKEYCGDSLQTLGMSGGQEVLLDKTFLDRLKFARSLFPSTRLVTVSNGTMLKGNLADSVINNLDGWVISLNLLNPTIYKEVMGWDFNETYNNILQFLKQKGNRKPVTTVQIFATKENQPLQEKAMAEMKSVMGKDDGFIFTELHNWAGKISGENPQMPLKRYPCKIMMDELFISAEGDCYPCCMGEAQPELKIGNILECSLTEILTGKKIKVMKRGHLRNSFESCGPCKNCFEWCKYPNRFFKLFGRWL